MIIELLTTVVLQVGEPKTISGTMHCDSAEAAQEILDDHIEFGIEISRETYAKYLLIKDDRGDPHCFFHDPSQSAIQIVPQEIVYTTEGPDGSPVYVLKALWHDGRTTRTGYFWTQEALVNGDPA